MVFLAFKTGSDPRAPYTLDSLSRGLGVNKADLVKARYGLVSAPEDLTERMSKLKKALSEQDNSEVEDILDGEKEEYEFAADKSSANQNLVKKELLVRNEKFVTNLPNYVTSKINTDINKVIDNQFKWYKMPINAWNYLFDSKEEIVNDFQSQINSTVNEKSISTYYVNRLTGFENLILQEESILFNSKSKTESIQGLDLAKIRIPLDKTLQTEFYDRMKLDMEDFANEIFWTIIIGGIIYIVFSIITKIACDNAAQKEWDKLKLRWDSDKGFFKNLARNALNILGTGINAEEARKRVEKKWKTRKKWINFWAFVVEILVSYFWIIKPQMAKEEALASNLTSKCSDILTNIDLPLLEYFNTIVSAL